METDFDSLDAEANIKELLLRTAASAADSIIESGDSFARGYVLAGLTPEYLAKDRVMGLSQLFLTMQLLKNSPDYIQQVIEKLKRIQTIALSKSNKLRVAVTCGSESRDFNEQSLHQFLSNVPKASGIQQSSAPFPSLINLQHPKAFLRMPSQISFVGMGVPGVEYVNPTGAKLSILSQLLTHKRLLPTIREKGGAYGAGAAYFGLGGVFSMTSYRDPVPETSVKVMQSAGVWATQQDFSSTDLEEAKMSIFKGIDALEDIHYEGMLQFLNGIDPEMAQRRREQLLDVTADDVRTAAQKYLVDGIESARTMVIGNRMPGRGLGWNEIAKPMRLS